MKQWQADNNPDFWAAADRLVAESEIVIDRPKGTRHPRYPAILYEVDYGYLAGTSSMDGGGIDIWRGSLPRAAPTALVCTIDMYKKDSEIKLLLGCTPQETQWVAGFHNSHESMKGLLLLRPGGGDGIF